MFCLGQDSRGFGAPPLHEGLSSKPDLAAESPSAVSAFAKKDSGPGFP